VCRADLDLGNSLICFMMIELNIPSALVMEDDSDRDVRNNSQVEDFAKASRLLLQPIFSRYNLYLDPTYHSSAGADGPLNFEEAGSATETPETNPYGDLEKWDLLWLGHCGTVMPESPEASIPLSRAVIFDDQTVPQTQHIDQE
jgi:hypothetical protein